MSKPRKYHVRFYFKLPTGTFGMGCIPFISLHIKGSRQNTQDAINAITEDIGECYFRYVDEIIIERAK